MLNNHLSCDAHAITGQLHGHRMGITCTKTWDEGWFYLPSIKFEYGLTYCFSSRCVHLRLRGMLLFG